MTCMYILGSGVSQITERYSYSCYFSFDLTICAKPIWLTKSSPTNVQIYLNPGLIELTRDAFFATPTSFGYKFKDQYVSSHPSQPEPELTIPLLALSATAVKFTSLSNVK
jgi:Domain of unknown function (DUF6532)